MYRFEELRDCAAALGADLVAASLGRYHAVPDPRPGCPHLHRLIWVPSDPPEFRDGQVAAITVTPPGRATATLGRFRYRKAHDLWEAEGPSLVARAAILARWQSF